MKVDNETPEQYLNRMLHHVKEERDAYKRACARSQTECLELKSQHSKDFEIQHHFYNLMKTSRNTWRWMAILFLLATAEMAIADVYKDEDYLKLKEENRKLIQLQRKKIEN